MSTLICSKQDIRVLIADDECDIANLIKMVLITKNIKTISNLHNLEKEIILFDPHVMVLDYSFGEYNILSHLPSIQKYVKKSIPLVYTAMNINDSIKTQLVNLGVMSVISKPCTISTLEAYIENYYDISLKYRS
jgi:DNA-binding response OmpR family regulator